MGIQTGYEIDPALVGEPHLRGIHHAFAAQAHRPPIEKSFAAWPDRDKAEIIDARAKNIRFGQT